MHNVYQFRNESGNQILYATEDIEIAENIFEKLPFEQTGNKTLCVHTEFEYELFVHTATAPVTFQDIQRVIY